MTFKQWLYGTGLNNPSIEGQWKTLHIVTLVICILLIVGLSFLFKNKSEKARRNLLLIISAILIFFELARRIVNITNPITFEKYNLLWAEIPVSGEYNLSKLLDTVPTSLVDKKTADYFPPALYKAIKTFSGKSDIRFLPLSYNPWIVVQKQNSSTKTKFEYSVGAYYTDGALATLSFVRELKSTGKELITIEQALSDLYKMSNDKTFITNVITYTNKDAYSALENNKVKQTILPIFYYNNLTVAQRLELSVKPIENSLITDATVAVFANRKTEEAKLAIEKAKQYLLNTELLYSTANARAWMPAHINTVSRSIYTDFIRKQARQVKSCLIPSTQFNSEKEKTELVKKLENALRTDYIAQ